MLLTATSTGPTGASRILSFAEGAFPIFSGDVRAAFSLPEYGKNFDAEACRITDPALDAALKEAAAKLLA